MKKILRHTDNEQGFVLIAALMMLMILLVVGIAATTSTTIELQISGNDKLAKQTFYQAEGVVSEAVRVIANDSSSNLEDSTSYPWLHLDPVGSGILTLGSGGTESADVSNDAFWTANGSDSLIPATGDQILRMTAAFRGIAPGGSLDLGSSRIHEYDVYGYCKQHNSRAVVKESLRVPF